MSNVKDRLMTASTECVRLANKFDQLGDVEEDSLSQELDDLENAISTIESQIEEAVDNMESDDEPESE